MKTITKCLKYKFWHHFPFFNLIFKRIVSLVFFVTFTNMVFAGGFMVNLMGTKQNGMGHTGVALKLDAAAVYFNPGMMSFLEDKYSFTGGVSAISSTAAYKSLDGYTTAQTNSPIGTPFNLYASIKISERFSAGLAVYTPFGSSLSWDDNWAGRRLSQNISLRAIYYQPTISYKIGSKFGVGVGLIFATGAVDINRAIVTPFQGSSNLTGNTSSWGFQVGVYAEPTEKLSLGITYKSQVTMNITNGTATLDRPSSLSSNLPSPNTFSAKLPLPATINAGVAYKFSDKFSLTADFTYVFYSAYDSLIFDFEKNTTSFADSRNPRKYSDSYIVRLGGQYKVTDKFTVRAGTYFDKSPVNNSYYSPETPDADRLGLSGGLSYAFLFNKKSGTAETTSKGYGSKLSIDLSFLYTYGFERTASYTGLSSSGIPENFAGTYRVNAYIPSLGLSYSF